MLILKIVRNLNIVKTVKLSSCEFTLIGLLAGEECGMSWIPHSVLSLPQRVTLDKPSSLSSCQAHLHKVGMLTIRQQLKPSGHCPHWILPASGGWGGMVAGGRGEGVMTVTVLYR